MALFVGICQLKKQKKTKQASNKKKTKKKTTHLESCSCQLAGQRALWETLTAHSQHPLQKSVDFHFKTPKHLLSSHEPREMTSQFEFDTCVFDAQLPKNKTRKKTPSLSSFNLGLQPFMCR